MKKIIFYLLMIPVIAAFLFSSTGCKKDNDSASNYVISAITDTSGKALLSFYYDHGKLTKYFSDATSSTDFYYNGNDLATVRSTTESGTISTIDTLIYDGQKRLVEVDNYDESSMLKIKTTIFNYNGDNTLNTATVDYVSPSNNDELHNYTYVSGKLTVRDDLVKIAGSYKNAYKYEFLSDDGHASPFVALNNPYFLDQLNSGIFFFWAYPNNVTSIKETSYDTTTGDVNNVYTASGLYTYNSLGLPTKGTFTQTPTTTIFLFQYEKK